MFPLVEDITRSCASGRKPPDRLSLEIVEPVPALSFSADVMLQVIEDVACTVCGCVCDDLRVTVDSGTIVSAERACPLAEPKLVGLRARKGLAASVGGREAPLAAAVSASAELLQKSRAPLIYGLSQSSTEGQRAACRLADHIGATIDTSASLCHGPSIMALQQVGESTCSLGESRHRSDLVIYWGSNPVVSHPRHMERYSVDADGQFVGGRPSRTLVVVDTRPTETAQLADLFIQVTPGSDFDLIWALRCLVADVQLPDTWQPPLGTSLATLRDLADRMKSCRGGTAFFGLGLTKSGVGHASVEALLRLVAELNAHTRFYARRMRVYGDVAGADSVLCWQTGYPFSVNLARGYPRYGPGEYSANELLQRHEVDACVLVGCDGLKHMSSRALDRLRAIPTILLDASETQLDWQPTIRFRTAKYGIDLPGTAYRMDEVPIPLRQVLQSELPSDGEILTAILEKLRS
jgi:formylmethanofuran dehydrogenase subunit B